MPKIRGGGAIDLIKQVNEMMWAGSLKIVRLPVIFLVLLNKVRQVVVG